MKKDDLVERGHLFRIGQRVRLTESGSRQVIVQKRAKGLGTVEDVLRLSVKVRPDGYKHAHWYSVNFWERVR